MSNPHQWKKQLSVTLFLMTILAFIFNCTQQLPKPTPEEEALLIKLQSRMGPEYSHPRLVSAELTVQMKNIRIEDHTAEDSLEAGPQLLVWSANPLNNQTQQLITAVNVSTPPSHSFKDPDHGNEILLWDIMGSYPGSSDLRLTRNFSYITFDYRPVVDKAAERQAWASIPIEILDLYTRSELFLEQDEALIDTVFTLLEDISGPVDQAQALFNWVRVNMEYVYPPPERGVRSAVATFRGDCGQYSALFMTMARIAGIPTRQQSGFNFYPGSESAHVWSEIYLPIKGWVPVDATREDGFLHLDNRRLIMSIGLNIPLEQAPTWATFNNSEVQSGCTDFMQMYTLAMRGVQAEFSSSREILRSVERR